MKKIIILISFVFIGKTLSADDGYRLWLKYDKIKDPSVRTAYANTLKTIVLEQKIPTLEAAVEELKMGLSGLLGKSFFIKNKIEGTTGNIILKIDPNLNVATNDPLLVADAYNISQKGSLITIAGKTETGVLYGVFAFLRHIQMGNPLSKLDISSHPKIQRRLLNHWDNPLGTIERGYAGSSLWNWYDLPEHIDPRYRDYARANASIGINGTVVNNVNASARFMTAEYLKKVAALASIFRVYGIKTYLSVRFSAPRNIGGLTTADPLDPSVQAWWKEKAKEIYSLIPDFGGFLVKANSEGEPGPQDYNLTHADGANMLADAISPFGGVVIWRAFVYKADLKSDRAKEAFREFKPLDGTFRKNVIVQVKNGPIDFQPREPFHPLFGAMPQTPLAMEFQITQEYLGFATHWVYLSKLFKEVLDTDTYQKGKGSTVAKVVNGTLHDYKMTAIAGVANTGSDRNWCGHIGNQANWYAYGRLAWDTDLTSEQIADEWIKMTLTTNPKSVSTIKNLMLETHQTTVDYMTPLGLHHIMGEGIHFGPQPWLEKSGRPDWTSIYYHRADSIGVGFDRTTTGSDALGLYHADYQALMKNAKTCSLDFLLWYHHVAWNEKLNTGRTLWEEICHRYYTGAEKIKAFQTAWASVKTDIDPQVHTAISAKLKVQEREAHWWRDACVLYFQTFANQPIPPQYPKPHRSLEEIKKLVEIYQLR